MRCSQAFLLFLWLSGVSHDDGYRISISGEHGNLVHVVERDVHEHPPARNRANSAVNHQSASKYQRMRAEELSNPPGSFRVWKAPTAGGGQQSTAMPQREASRNTPLPRSRSGPLGNQRSTLSNAFRGEFGASTAQRRPVPSQAAAPDQSVPSVRPRLTTPRATRPGFVKGRRRAQGTLNKVKTVKKKAGPKTGSSSSDPPVNVTQEIDPDAAIETVEDCCVCLERMKTDARSTKCGHWLCNDCIVAGQLQKCPICRRFLFDDPLDIEVQAFRFPPGFDVNGNPRARQFSVSGSKNWNVRQLKQEINQYAPEFWGRTHEMVIFAADREGTELDDDDMIPRSRSPEGGNTNIPKAIVWLDFRERASSSSSPALTRGPSLTDLLPGPRSGQARSDLPSGNRHQEFVAAIDPFFTPAFDAEAERLLRTYGTRGSITDNIPPAPRARGAV